LTVVAKFSRTQLNSRGVWSRPAHSEDGTKDALAALTAGADMGVAA
jgi:hypothetical protein